MTNVSKDLGIVISLFYFFGDMRKAEGVITLITPI